MIRCSALGAWNNSADKISAIEESIGKPPVTSGQIILSDTTQPDIAVPAEQVFLEQRVNSFDRQTQIVGTPELPAIGFVIEYTVIEPLAFDLCLNSKLLKLLERRGNVVTR